MVSLLLVACGDDDTNVGPDAARFDAGVQDGSSGFVDAAARDARAQDAALVDASDVDALSLDANGTDALVGDAAPDAAPADAQLADALPDDAAPVDAFPVDASPADAFPPDAFPVDAIPDNSVVLGATCESGPVLTAGTYTTDMSGHVDSYASYAGTCTDFSQAAVNLAGNDGSFSVDVPAGQYLEVDVQVADTGFRMVLSDTCANITTSCQRQHESGVGWINSTGSVQTITVVFDAMAGGGNVEFTVTLSDPAVSVLPGDTCQSAVRLSGSTSYVITDRTEGYHNLYSDYLSAGCGTQAQTDEGPDRVYVVELADGEGIVAVNRGGSLTNSRIAFVTDCADPIASCTDFGFAPPGERNRSGGPKDYYVIVGAMNSSDVGQADITITVRPPL